VNKDIKAITNAYGLSINNTTRNADSYGYTPREYSSIRGEHEEGISSLKKKIALELNNMAHRASRGLKEDYFHIMAKMNKLHKDISSVITNV
jgi:hypothetical protein